MPRLTECQTGLFGLLARMVSQIIIISATISNSGIPSEPMLCSQTVVSDGAILSLVMDGVKYGSAVGLQSMWINLCEADAGESGFATPGAGLHRSLSTTDQAAEPSKLAVFWIWDCHTGESRAFTLAAAGRSDSRETLALGRLWRRARHGSFMPKQDSHVL